MAVKAVQNNLTRLKLAAVSKCKTERIAFVKFPVAVHEQGRTLEGGHSWKILRGMKPRGLLDETHNKSKHGLQSSTPFR